MLKTIWKFISLQIISTVTWGKIHAFFNRGKMFHLTFDDWNKLAVLCKEDHYVILTRRRTHLTTYLISLGGLIKLGKFGYWSHAFLNLEDEVDNMRDFMFAEAIGKGVVRTKFTGVFDCDSVVLLRPKGFTSTDWTEAMDKIRTLYGRPYDTLFDLAQDNELSCVELVRDALKASTNYEENFKDFESGIAKAKGLTPDMFYRCKDFEIVLEIRR